MIKDSTLLEILLRLLEIGILLGTAMSLFNISNSFALIGSLIAFTACAYLVYKLGLYIYKLNSTKNNENESDR